MRGDGMAEPLSRDDGAPSAAPPPGIRIEGLQKRFATQPVLRGVNLEIGAGELMVIIGLANETNRLVNGYQG